MGVEVINFCGQSGNNSKGSLPLQDWEKQDILCHIIINMPTGPNRWLHLPELGSAKVSSC